MLHQWKTTLQANDKVERYLVAADVQSLYPNISRICVKDGVSEALKLCSNYSSTVRDTLVEITMFCLENVVIKNDTTFYHQKDGIITGDNNSVSLANIALHYILVPIHKTLNKSIIFKRYIDDIIWISETQELTTQIQTELVETFKKKDLNLVIRKISTKEGNKTLEFLDVDHVICNNVKGGFYTTNFVKPTAIDRTFLNGSSYHPRNIFRSIIYSEAIRFRRLNELDEHYHKSLEVLKKKCYTSGFNKEMVDDMITLAKQWKERFSPPNSNVRDDKPKTVWVTHFPAMLRPSRKEKELNPAAMVAYKRPKTLGGTLTSYRSLAHNSGNTKVKGSRGCNHCKLCGKYGGENMVNNTAEITSPSGTTYKIHHLIKCKDYGIYVATCRRCPAQYVGQTVKTFSERWNTHRSTWNRGSSKDDDQAALLIHYRNHHMEHKNVKLSDAFSVTFVDCPLNPKDLDMLESSWISRLESRININKTILPKYR